MGLAISYRGSLADPDRVEDFEDRVLDLALELGGQARIWRSAGKDSRRMVRGVMLNLFPGQETFSLLLSPENWLIGLIDIEEAEAAQLEEKPWCSVKTQYGPLEGHVAIVEVLTVLKREFMSDLEVLDEGEYWERRDVAVLAKKKEFLQAAIESFAEQLESHGLSREAAEDPEILASRIERIAELVKRQLSRPAEHPPVHWDDEDFHFGVEDEDEAKWDEFYKENRRRQERVNRAIEEHLARGEEIEDALEGAMREETAAGLPEDDESESSDDWDDWGDADEEADEPWRESLAEEHGEAEDDFTRPERHPLLQRASDLFMRLHDLFESRQHEARNASLDALFQGVGDLCGGLAQALGGDEADIGAGLAGVQFKRALRGTAFALGALFPLRADGLIAQPVFDELHETLDGIQAEIFFEMRKFRGS